MAWFRLELGRCRLLIRGSTHLLEKHIVDVKKSMLARVSLEKCSPKPSSLLVFWVGKRETKKS